MSVGPRPVKRNRAAARREKRGASSPRAVTRTAPSLPVRPLVLLWLGATGLLLWLVVAGIGDKITWYLAVDQYGYLAFAHDLMAGRIFHHWAPIEALAKRLPATVDVLSQTYIYDHGRLYCRYAPGFAIVLAGWLSIFGDDGAHYLNPTIYVLLLVLLLAFQRRVFGSRWRATVGVALVILCPSMLHLWGITLTRDLCAHLFGILGVFLVLPNGGRLSRWRLAAAGMALGYTVTTRPDGILYLVPATLVVLLRLRRERTTWRPAVPLLAAGALGLLVGVAPFLGYNWIATGNPLRPTQGMEIQQFLTGTEITAPPPSPTSGARVGYPPGAWRGGVYEAVQGGGLRLENLSRVLPGNFRLLQHAYGNVLLGTALWGAVLALFQRRVLFCAVVPYVVLALFFYSCWSRPDGRYLAGIHALLPVLMVEGLFGTLDAVRRLARHRRVADAQRLGVGVGAVLLFAAAFVSLPRQQPGSALPVLAMLVPVGAAAAALAAGVWPRRRVARFAAPALALALVGVSAYRAAAAPKTRAAFQKAQMHRARATFAAAVKPNSVVITSEDIGRPAENIDYYSGVAHAFYITDLMRWRIAIWGASDMLLKAGMTPYLLLPTTQPGLAGMIANLRNGFDVDLVADIPPRQAMDYFVAAPFHRGVALHLYRIGKKA